MTQTTSQAGRSFRPRLGVQRFGPGPIDKASFRGVGCECKSNVLAPALVGRGKGLESAGGHPLWVKRLWKTRGVWGRLAGSEGHN